MKQVVIGNFMNNIIWLASYPKSGNTLLRSILYAAVNDKFDLNRLGEFSPSFASVASLQGNGHFANAGDIRHHWNSAQRLISMSAGAKHKFIKTHNISGKFDVGFFPLPEFTHSFIYIYRDPRDVCISFSKHFNLSIEDTITEMTDKKNVIARKKNNAMGEFISSWDQHVMSWKNNRSRSLFLKFEDLVETPTVKIREILDFCSIKSSSSVEEIANTTDFKNLKRLENQNGFSEKSSHTDFFRSGRIGQWETEQIDFSKLEASFSNTMELLGYDI